MWDESFTITLLLDPRFTNIENLEMIPTSSNLPNFYIKYSTQENLRKQKSSNKCSLVLVADHSSIITLSIVATYINRI